MEQMDFSIEVSESETEKFADYLYQKEMQRQQSINIWQI